LSGLQSALSDEANEKLSLILEKGRTDYNITIIIGDQAKSASSYAYEKWFKSNASTSDGIWVGSGITEQYLLKANKTTSEMHDEITSEFAFSLQKGKVVKVKILKTRAEVEDDE
jgi:S-DNA-T family DNA segregation ATPase FtsK/SpoIIIE